MRYSASTGGFYPENRTYPNLPNDLVTITDEVHALLIEAQGQGKVILPDAQGYPQAVDPPAPAPTPQAVNAERDRRVRLGAAFTPAGYGQAIPVAGDEQTKVNLLALATAAQARMAQGDMTTPTPYRDENNVIHQLTPPQVFDLWSQGAAYVSAVYQASWALKDGPIPADYADDGYWP